MKGEGDLVLK